MVPQETAKLFFSAERWADVTRRIRLDIEIQELEEGSYQPVVLQKLDSSCGGVFQLRAGMSRRIKGSNNLMTFMRVYLFI